MDCDCLEAQYYVSASNDNRGALDAEPVESVNIQLQQLKINFSHLKTIK